MIGLGDLGIRTDRNIMEMMDPVSACSPTDLTRLPGNLERIRTTGVPVVSCRSLINEEVR